MLSWLAYIWLGSGLRLAWFFYIKHVIILIKARALFTFGLAASHLGRGLVTFGLVASYFVLDFLILGQALLTFGLAGLHVA